MRLCEKRTIENPGTQRARARESEPQKREEGSIKEKERERDCSLLFGWLGWLFWLLGFLFSLRRCHLNIKDFHSMPFDFVLIAGMCPFFTFLKTWESTTSTCIMFMYCLHTAPVLSRNLGSTVYCHILYYGLYNFSPKFFFFYRMCTTLLST